MLEPLQNNSVHFSLENSWFFILSLFLSAFPSLIPYFHVVLHVGTIIRIPNVFYISENLERANTNHRKWEKNT